MLNIPVGITLSAKHEEKKVWEVQNNARWTRRSGSERFPAEETLIKPRHDHRGGCFAVTPRAHLGNADRCFFSGSS